MKVKTWYRSKTTWTGITAVVGGTAGIITGELDVAQGVQIILTGLIGIFLRQGIKNS